MMRFLIPMILLALSVGFYFGRITTNPKEISPPSQSDSDSAKQKLADEIKRLPEDGLDCEKSHEILGRIVQLLIVDLGVRLSEKQKVQVETPLMRETPLCSPREEKSVSSSVTTVEDKKNPAAEPPAIKSLLQTERGLRQITNAKDAEEFLKTNQVDNLFDYLKSSTALGLRDLRGLQGTYSGEIHFFKKRGSRVDLEISFSMDRRTRQSTYAIILSEDGRPLSETTGDGAPKNFLQAKDLSSSIIIQTTPRSYAQTYINRGTNTLMGNYYEEQKVGTHVAVGTFTLYRR